MAKGELGKVKSPLKGGFRLCLLRTRVSQVVKQGWLGSLKQLQ